MAKKKSHAKSRNKKNKANRKQSISKRPKKTGSKPIEEIKTVRKSTTKNTSKASVGKVHSNKKTATNKAVKSKIKRKQPTEKITEIIRTSDKVRKDSSKSIKAAGISRAKGAKIIAFKLTAQKLENKIVQFNKSNADKELDLLQFRDKPKGSKSYRPPKGVIIIIKGKNGEGELAFPSPPDFVVNKTNVKAFVNGVLEKSVGEIYKRSDKRNRKNLWVSSSKKKFDVSGEPVDPTQISEVLIRYIYHTDK